MLEPETSSGGETLVDKAVKVWRKAQIVHLTPSWQGQPEARVLVEKLALHPEYESSLVDLLAAPSQLVVAYSLLTLELMGSRRLRELPSELLTNRSNITLSLGSFRNGMDLGSLARQVQKRAKKGADES
jgi:hypothetical protein